MNIDFIFVNPTYNNIFEYSINNGELHSLEKEESLLNNANIPHIYFVIMIYGYSFIFI